MKNQLLQQLNELKESLKESEKIITYEDLTLKYDKLNEDNQTFKKKVEKIKNKLIECNTERKLLENLLNKSENEKNEL